MVAGKIKRNKAEFPDGGWPCYAMLIDLERFFPAEAHVFPEAMQCYNLRTEIRAHFESATRVMIF